MPDPELESNNCDGETSTAQVGNDLASGTPNKRLVNVKHDHRTLVNDDTIPAPLNGGDLPGGLKVNLCSEDAEQPWDARVTGTPILASGSNTAVVAVPTSNGANPLNAIRVQQDAGTGDCGLVVSPPKFSGVGAMPRAAIIDNEAPGTASVTQSGPKIGTIKLANPDTVPRLFRIKGRFSTILELDENNGAGEPINLLQITYASKLNDHATNHLDPGVGDAFVGGGTLNTRVATIVHPEGDFNGFTVNDQREFIDEVILAPGLTRYVHYFTQTIRSRNFLIGGTEQRGVNIVGVSVEEVYAVGGF